MKEIGHPHLSQKEYIKTILPHYLNEAKMVWYHVWKFEDFLPQNWKLSDNYMSQIWILQVADVMHSFSADLIYKIGNSWVLRLFTSLQRYSLYIDKVLKLCS